MGPEDFFDWEHVKTRLQTASSRMEAAYQQCSAWIQRQYDEPVRSRGGSDALEGAMATRRRFLREVPYIYRLNFVLISTGLVFMIAPGVMRRVALAGLVGGLGVLLAVPEVTPWNRR